MLQIAGGILLAIIILAALPYILVAAVWILVIGVGLAIAVIAWLALAATFGEGWAWGITIASSVALLLWIGIQEDQDNDVKCKDNIIKPENDKGGQSQGKEAEYKFLGIAIDPTKFSLIYIIIICILSLSPLLF